MYDRYQGLIFDMDGTILDTEPTHRKAWREVLSRYGMTFDEAAMVALSGSPTWRIAQAIIASHQADLDPHHGRGENPRGGSDAVGQRAPIAADRGGEVLSWPPSDGGRYRQ